MESKKIYLAGGCFWGVEEFFSRIDGVIDTISGYANGRCDETSYKNIKQTDHSETVIVEYDSSKINLSKILDYYFLIIDPVSINKQGEDFGRQYRTGIYYENEDDLEIINKKIDEVQKQYSKKIAVEVEKLRNYIIAEEYHQDYLAKNPNGYCHIDMSLANKL